MNRRQVLVMLGAVSTGPIAGCSASDGGGGDDMPADSPTASPTLTDSSIPSPTPTDSPTPSPTPTPTTPNEQALEHYQAAVETLVEIKKTLDKWAENAINNMERVKELQDKLATARDGLAAAEEHADPGGELSTQIEQVGLVADFQELILAYSEAALLLVRTVSDANTFGDNEQHQKAADAFADGRQLIEDAQRVIDDMETVLSELDPDMLEESRLEYTGEPRDHLGGPGRKALDGADSYLRGRKHIHLAFVKLDEGQRFMDADEFTQGREAWETGRSHVETAKTGFNAAIDNSSTPKDTRDKSFNFLGIANGLLDAFDKFVAGAKEAEAGNTDKAAQLIQEGYDILGETFEE